MSESTWKIEHGPQEKSPWWEDSKKLKVIAGAVAVGVVAGLVYFKFFSSRTTKGHNAIIKADNRPFREKPLNPGGQQIPHQERDIYKSLSGTHNSDSETVVLTPEAPVHSSDGWKEIAPSKTLDPQSTKVEMVKVTDKDSHSTSNGVQEHGMDEITLDKPVNLSRDATPTQLHPAVPNKPSMEENRIAQKQSAPSVTEEPETPLPVVEKVVQTKKKVTTPPKTSIAAAQAATKRLKELAKARKAGLENGRTSKQAAPHKAAKPFAAREYKLSDARPIAPAQKIAPPPKAFPMGKLLKNPYKSTLPREKIDSSVVILGPSIQLVAAKSHDEAVKRIKGYKDPSKPFYPLLKSLNFSILKADLGKKGTFYRVRVGPFANKKDAQKRADQLKARGVNCFVVMPA